MLATNSLFGDAGVLGPLLGRLQLARTLGHLVLERRAMAGQLLFAGLDLGQHGVEARREPVDLVARSVRGTRMV
jgi:hypothetical protein